MFQKFRTWMILLNMTSYYIKIWHHITSTYQFTNLYIAKYEWLLSKKKSLDMFKSRNDFLNYGKFLSKRKWNVSGRTHTHTHWLTAGPSSFYSIDVCNKCLFSPIFSWKNLEDVHHQFLQSLFVYFSFNMVYIWYDGKWCINNAPYISSIRIMIGCSIWENLHSCLIW